MKTLAALKRELKPGMKLNLVHCLVGPVPPEKQFRILKSVRSADLVFTMQDGRTSYCRFPSAKDYELLPNGFRFLEDGIVAAQYDFIKE